jgi:nicotinamidase-related amidase
VTARARQTSPEQLFPRTTPAAHLVVIDMQRVFADADSPWATPDFGAILPTVAALVKTFGDAVTFTRFVAPEQPIGAWRDYYAEWPFALQPPDAPLWDVVPELGTTGPTVNATTFSKWGPSLAERVGDATMVLCGVSTDCCVLSTAVAAADAGVAVRVVADACAGVSAASHRATLDVLALYGPLVRVVSSAELP